MDLTPKQKKFADYYIECGNATEAYKKAYECKNDTTCRTNGNKNLHKPTITAYISERTKPAENKRIATADEVMEYLTRVMYGEEKDAFGLDASLSDRTTAAKEIMKRHNVAGDTNKGALEKLDDVLNEIGGVI